MATLTQSDLTRYHRQMLIEGWGESGQKKLQSSSVFIAGAGGLGSPVSFYLAVAGIGEIRICDADRVELSNLNRQILHNDTSIGGLKATSAEKTLRALNPKVKVVTCSDRLDDYNVERIVGMPDVIVDCLDNFETRYLLNAYCIRQGIPLVHGAVWAMSGQVTFLQPPETPCLRCLFPKRTGNELAPVIGVAAGLTGCVQAFEVLKYLTGLGDLLKGRLLLLEGAEMRFTSFRVERRHSCPDCGNLG
jgi:molybdopterin/thiamine biosynthesis adenylyltransferase